MLRDRERGILIAGDDGVRLPAMCGVGRTSSVWVPRRRPFVGHMRGRADGVPARLGAVVLVHGGGWITQDGPVFAENMRPMARVFARRGLRAVVASYTPGPTGIDDVLATVDRERERRGDDRICLYGESAGGHWTLMAAARRRWLRCVVAMVPPTDLVRETLHDPAGDLAKLARRAFGAQRVPFLSPRQIASRIRARVLLVSQRDDPLVDRQHALSMHRALTRSTLVTVEPGDTLWMHGSAMPTAIRAMHKRVGRFVAKNVGARVKAPRKSRKRR